MSTTVPHDDPEASRLICEVISQHYSELLSTPEPKMESGGSFSMVPSMCVTYLKNRIGQHLTIWFNASPMMVMGGRSVEAGQGPHYYTTVEELRLAIEAALWQLEHPDEEES
jgi:hypothetical protein